MPTLSVVICTRNRYRDVLRCMASLAAQTRVPEEIVIVDASDDEYVAPTVAAAFPGAFPDCRVLRSPRGLTRQRNHGIRQTQGDYVLFLDDDVVLHREYVERLLRVFHTDTAARYAGGMGQISGVSSPGPLFRLLQRCFYLGDVVGTGRFKRSGFPSLPHGRDEFLEVECLSGANMCFRRSVVSQFTFDETLHDYAYMEDDDFAYRASRERPFFYEPDARLEHRHSTAARLNRRQLKRMLVRNHRYLFNKNFPQSFSYRWAHGLSLLGLLAECVMTADLKGLAGAVEGILSRQPPALTP